MLGSIWDIGVVAPLLVVLSPPFQSSVFSALGVDFAQMGQYGPHLHSYCVGLLLWDFFSTSAQGMAGNLGGVLFSGCSVLTTVGASGGGNWPRCSHIKQVHGSWHSIRPWGIIHVLWGCSFRLLSFLGSVTSGGQKDLLHVGAFLWDMGFPQISLALGYTQSQVWMWQLWLLTLPLAFRLLP